MALRTLCKGTYKWNFADPNNRNLKILALLGVPGVKEAGRELLKNIEGLKNYFLSQVVEGSRLNDSPQKIWERKQGMPAISGVCKQISGGIRDKTMTGS